MRQAAQGVGKRPQQELALLLLLLKGLSRVFDGLEQKCAAWADQSPSSAARELGARLGQRWASVRVSRLCLCVDHSLLQS